MLAQVSFSGRPLVAGTTGDCFFLLVIVGLVVLIGLGMLHMGTTLPAQQARGPAAAKRCVGIKSTILRSQNPVVTRVDRVFDDGTVETTTDRLAIDSHLTRASSHAFHDPPAGLRLPIRRRFQASTSLRRVAAHCSRLPDGWQWAAVIVSSPDEKHD
jgi:hypothetical protein